MTNEGRPGARSGASHDAQYVLIWAVLVVALLVSVVLGSISLPVVTLVLIFSIAVVKAYLVLAYFIHLNREPLFVVLIVGAGLACIYFLFFGLVPDVVFTPKH